VPPQPSATPTQGRVPNPGLVCTDRLVRKPTGAICLDPRGGHRRCGGEWAGRRLGTAVMVGRARTTRARRTGAAQLRCKPITCHAWTGPLARVQSCESLRRGGKLGICYLPSTIIRCARAEESSPLRKRKPLRTLERAHRGAGPSANHALGPTALTPIRAGAVTIAAVAMGRPSVASRSARFGPTILRSSATKRCAPQG
jgi:hypothetical protein